MEEEITVTVPAPAPPPPPPAIAATDSSLAMALGELKGLVASQHETLSRLLSLTSENQGALSEIAARTELLVQQETESDDDDDEPEQVAIPPPLLVDALPADPITPASPGHENLPPKRRLGMLHGW